jgi:hypothetical protein
MNRDLGVFRKNVLSQMAAHHAGDASNQNVHADVTNIG